LQLVSLFIYFLVFFFILHQLGWTSCSLDFIGRRWLSPDSFHFYKRKKKKKKKKMSTNKMLRWTPP
jgi:hypothetical protein